MEKISKESAGYLEPEERFKSNFKERCNNCTMFNKDGSCDLVKGKIKPRAWCKRWTDTPSKD